jgi:HK97 family phage portal protein
MSIVGRTKSAVKAFVNYGRPTIEMDQLLNFLGLDKDTASGKSLSEATYFACLKVLSESIGKMPLKVLQRGTNGGVETAYCHNLYKVLHDRPNLYMTSSVFWSTVEFNRNHFGNAYVWIDGLGDKTNLWILPFNEVQIIYDDAKIMADQTDVYYKYSHGGHEYMLKSSEVMHFKTSNTIDGLVGISVREQLANTIDSGKKSQKMLNQLYDDGFTAKAVLNYTGSINDESTKELVRLTESYAHGDLKNEGIRNIIPIPCGFNLTPWNGKLADNQFLELRKYTALQIASAFGIKPNQIGDYEKSSYSSAQAQQLSFYIDTLLYPIKQYEEEITYKLMSDQDIANGIYAKFNIASILRADMETQIKTLKEAVTGGIYTLNEAREMLDKPSKPGGDILLVNGTYMPAELAGKQYSIEPAKGGEG